MSPIGRIFIVLNLVLAVAFLGWASSALANSQDFKAELEAAKLAHAETEARLTDEVSTERQRAEKAENDLNRTAGELSNKSATLAQLRDQHSATEDTLGELKANYDGLEELMQGYDERNGELSTQKDELNANLMDAVGTNNDLTNERDALQLAKNNLERDLKTANDDIAGLEKVAQGLRNDVQDRDTVIATAEAIFGEKMSDLMNMPHISGAVLMVSSEMAPGLVSINRGSADSVQRGFTFDIYSGGQYKGRVRVVDVQENQCFAVIEKTYEGRSIAQGDSAATHI